MTKILRNDLIKISNLIQKNEKVLDVGCGDGALLPYLNSQLASSSMDYYGIDVFSIEKSLLILSSISSIFLKKSSLYSLDPTKSFGVILTYLKSIFVIFNSSEFFFI